MKFDLKGFFLGYPTFGPFRSGIFFFGNIAGVALTIYIEISKSESFRGLFNILLFLVQFKGYRNRVYKLKSE